MTRIRVEGYPILGDTVWRSQAVGFSNSHGLPTVPVDRATPHYELPPILGCIRSRRVVRALLPTATPCRYH